MRFNRLPLALLIALAVLATAAIGYAVGHSAKEPVTREALAGSHHPRGAKDRSGQWIIEQPSTFHQAANNGKRKIIIHLATLLKAGAPPSSPVG